ncbi:hypothetical protein E4T48_01159 [Aureobasidium sp. EXF-10727]|nr:hypothetical protein E4T48_01159 [Aureobasidium sp. EXF-10727]
MRFERDVSANEARVDLPRSYSEKGGVFDDWRRVGERPNGCSDPQKNPPSSREDPEDIHKGVKNIDRATTPEDVDHVLVEQIGHAQPTCSPPPYSPLLQTTLPATPKDARVPLKRPRVVNTPSTVEVAHTIHPEPHTPTIIKFTRDNENDSFTSSLLNIQQDTPPSAISTSDRSETPGIQPTIFKNRHELPRYSPKAEEMASQTDQENLSMKVVRNFASAHESVDTLSSRSVVRSLNEKLRTLVSAKVPLLTQQALQRVMEDLLESLEYGQKVAEVDLQETTDNLKIELQLETEKGVEEIGEHAEDTLTNIKVQMEDLASGHLLAFEDMLQRTGEQLKQTLKAFLEVLAKAVALDKHNDDQTANEDTVPYWRDQQTVVPSDLHSPVAPGIADSPAAAATKLFLHEVSIITCEVEWNSTKDRSLWKIISKASNSKELDCMSAKFEVSLAFLLQQAAWLYERHFAQMKAQMKKLSPSACPSPMPPDSTGNVAVNSNATAFAVGSQGLSRTPSTRTLTQSRTGPPASPAQPSNRAFNAAFGNHRKPVSPQRETSEPDSDPLQESDSDSSDGESQSMARSQAFRRPAHYNKGKYGYDDEDEDEDGESSGGFLPFATTATGSADPAATLKSPVKRASEQRTMAPDSSASSASSAAAIQTTARTGKQREAHRGDYAHASPASALSPRHREELSKLSPRVRRDGSEGTPSMGSSFSDLDDASISQSAIEEAFMSHMQHGSTTSRMSSISQALRSKYL